MIEDGEKDGVIRESYRRCADAIVNWHVLGKAWQKMGWCSLKMKIENSRKICLKIALKQYSYKMVCTVLVQVKYY